METTAIVIELIETKEYSHSFLFCSGYITALIDHNIISEDVHSELETILEEGCDDER